jgi:hypothetical protein
MRVKSGRVVVLNDLPYRAHTPRELREVVGLVQPVQRVAPSALVHQLVPLGDFVAEGAAGGSLVAEGGAAVHAPCARVLHSLPFLDIGGLVCVGSRTKRLKREIGRRFRVYREAPGSPSQDNPAAVKVDTEVKVRPCRALCVASRLSVAGAGSCRCTSFQSFSRSVASRKPRASRSYSWKPRSFLGASTIVGRITSTTLE